MPSPVARKNRLYLIPAGILLAGLGCALAIYLAAPAGDESSLVQEFENSKLYRHELEAYGGKLSVVSSELFGWFRDLWHGRALAGTVALLTLLAAGVAWLLVHHLGAEDVEGEQ